MLLSDPPALARSGDRPAGRSPLVQFEGVTKRYGPITALDGLSLALHAGEVHGLCGHNGAGKSTAVKLLAGLIAPDEGVIRIDGHAGALSDPVHAQHAGIAVVDQEISVIGSLTVAENLFLGRAGGVLVHRRQSEREAQALLARVGLEAMDPSRLVHTLELGERQLVEIARALGRDARVLVLDEPTATLSEVEIEAVFGAVRLAASHGACVLFVSHRLGEVLGLCARVTVLRDGKLERTVAAAELKRDELVRLMIGSVPQAPPRAVADAAANRTRVSVRDVIVPGRVARFDVELHGGDIVVLAGQVGSGSSDVLRALAGLVPGATGRVTIGAETASFGDPVRAARSGITFLSNDRKAEGLFMSHSVATNIVATRLQRYTRLGVLRMRRVRVAARPLAERVGLAKRLRSRVDQLSGGNQQKVFVGRALDHDRPRLLLLDEPTRGVDVGGRADIHALIRRAADAGDGVILNSTELDEILDLADIIVTMFKGEVVAVHRRDTVSPNQVVAEMTHSAAEAGL